MPVIRVRVRVRVRVRSIDDAGKHHSNRVSWLGSFGLGIGTDRVYESQR